MPRHAHGAKANRIVTAAKHGARTRAVLTVDASFLGEQFKTPSEVHGKY